MGGILNSDKEEKSLQVADREGIIENEEPLCSSPASSGKEKRMGRTTYKTAPKGGLYTRLSVDDGITDRKAIP